LNESSALTALSGHVDREFYLAIYEDVRLAKVDPVRHYARWGWREWRDPSPAFSTAAYLKTYSDALARDEPPPLQAVRLGHTSIPSRYAEAYKRWLALSREGEIPPSRPYLSDVEIVSTELNRAHYEAQLRASGLDPEPPDMAAHFIEVGASRGLDPTSWFSTSRYLTAYPDVAAAGSNPFLDYLRSGRREGRSPSPGRSGASLGAKEIERVRAEFDQAFYARVYPGVVEPPEDPFAHFMQNGWRARLDPNPYFSTRAYLDANPDLERKNKNPLVHYVLEGRAERRFAKPREFRSEAVRAAQTARAHIEQRRRSCPPVAEQPASVLTNAWRTRSVCALKNLYLTCSHDNFAENVGGIQLCIARESQRMVSAGFDHLHLFPSTPITVVLEEDVAPSSTGVVLNGELVGHFSTEAIAAALRKWSYRRKRVEFAVHSLLGHSEQTILAVARAADVQQGYFWVHDFGSVCDGYTLLRNGVQFCGPPPPDSLACSVCVYGEHRRRQMQAHRKLFEGLAMTVIAPSRSAAEIWRAGVDLPHAGLEIHPHCSLRPAGGASVEASTERPLRVGYLGHPVTHKGWPAFYSLVMHLRGDPRYEFFHLGKAPTRLPVRYEPVVVGVQDLDAMRRAVDRLQIDVALIWSLWPETFCFTAYEAVAGGAAVLTYKDSGNVADLVVSQGCGAVLQSEEELLRMFKTGAVLSQRRAARGVALSELTYSGMTADFVLAA
jgi:hypothetical protein